MILPYSKSRLITKINNFFYPKKKKKKKKKNLQYEIPMKWMIHCQNLSLKYNATSYEKRETFWEKECEFIWCTLSNKSSRKILKTTHKPVLNQLHHTKSWQYGVLQIKVD